MRRLVAILSIGMLGALVACSGDKGPKGETGDPGTQGDPGAQGTPGATGDAGPAGDPGANGEAGTIGPAGAVALITSTDEAPGTNCTNGGKRIDAGLDLDANNVLDTAEITTTTYVCDTPGLSALTLTTDEPPGTNCANGGLKIETGLDADSSGVLDATEINAAATTYACNIAPQVATSPTKGINATIKDGDVSTATGPITVRFTLKDDLGLPLDINGVYSVNTPIQPRFALAWFTKDTAGNVLPLNVYTQSGTTPQPTAYNPLGRDKNNQLVVDQGTLVENGVGAGDYTYTFPTTTTTGGAVAVAYDSTKLNQTHVVWIQVSRQTDLVFQTNALTFSADNESHYYVPDGSVAPITREIAATSGCTKCHDHFKPETTTSAAFHGGGRIDATFCNVCHNPARTSGAGADANSARFVHRIHYGEHIATANQFHNLAVTYPQDIRNCDTCHKDAANGAQAQSNPTRAACGSCHDYAKFDGSVTTPSCASKLVDATTGLRVPCQHSGGVRTDDSLCSTCHGATQIKGYHTPVAPPDPNNAWLVNGGNANTNAANLAAGGFVPTGAKVITYDVSSVSTWTEYTAPTTTTCATSATCATGLACDPVALVCATPITRPQIKFKLKADGTDVVFQTYVATTTTELMPNFFGSPSVYFAWAVPQDGIAKPADFNASASGYIRSIWNGTATGTAAGKLTGPDTTGYYTIQLTGVQVPSTATMLTGGVGYTYSLGTTKDTSGNTIGAPNTGSPPLTQTNVTGYPLSTDGKFQGGLIVPAPNVWKVATGFTGRRPIVDTAKCANCHSPLGVEPTFHAGQRNDGPTCSFCHTPNRTSSGWSAGSKYFIHAIHAGRKRETPFTWHAAVAGEGYGDVEFPSPLNECTSCHVDGGYDFTSSGAQTATPTVTTVGTGKYNKDQATNPTGWFSISPYVTADNVTDYGAGFAFNAATGVTTEALGTTLVISPIMTVCSACHDSLSARSHMGQNGGSFYQPRSSVIDANGQTAEQCMICHGPGRVAAIGLAHWQ